MADATAERPRRLNVGCGHDIRSGWVNLDVAALAGVDVVHDLDRTPWPFADASFDTIIMINVLEHLPDTVRIMEELHRISADRGRVTIRVPYWNSPDAITDPTHKADFNQHTFDFFDPTTRHGRERAYYSTARFFIRRRTYYARLVPGLPYLPVTWSVFRWPMSLLATFLGGIIWVLEVELEAHKPESATG
jgi:SAM-dependent methyltransferase